MEDIEKIAKNFKRSLFIWISVSIIIIALVGTSFGFGFRKGLDHKSEAEKADTVVNKDDKTAEVVDFEPFWKVWNIINEKFVTAKEPISDQDKVWGAIEGLTASLGDPYSVFLKPVASELFEEEIRGKFGGVGMEVGMKDNVLTVIAPLKGNPAERAGILAGDKIIEIDHESTAGLGIDTAVSKIRGKIGEPVALKLVREKVIEPIDVIVIRDNITIPTVDTELRDDGIFIIELHNFSAISSDLFRQALREFVSANSDKLILDLRGNPGGFLEAAVDIASWFLPAGDIIVEESRGGDSEKIEHVSKKGYGIFNDQLKLAVLIDGGSASASEILAGALKEHGKAILVGAKTFGKGSVQELVKITSDTNLKITVAEWLTPKGNSISKYGIKPDYEIELTADDIKNGKDPQLEKAVEILKTK